MKGLLLGLSFISLNVWADPTALTADFKSLLKRYGVGSASDQAYCYQEDNKVQGYQVDRLQRIASVTKLFTTYLASETLDLHKRYKTKIFISGDKMHIQGSSDPYFEEEKMLLLMQALNDAGYTSFSQVTFDKNLIFSDQALSAHMDITPSYTRGRLAAYLNAKNASYVRTKWREISKFAAEEGVDLNASKVPSLTAKTVTLVEKNPLLTESPIILEHTSKPLHSILKSMNVMSKNIVAQNVYLESSKIKTFDTLMKEKGIASTSFKIYNGSGLPMKGQKRLDNLASCRLVLNIVDALNSSLKKHNLVLVDVVAINGGEDLGSFRTRFEDYPDTYQAVISKTGTLMHASSLAGVLLTEKVVPFAILNHTTKVAQSRNFQDNFVARMFHHLGDAVPFDYSKISIFPWDNSSFLTEPSLTKISQRAK